MNKTRADLSENMLTPVYFIKKFSTKIRPSFQLPPESISLLRLWGLGTIQHGFHPLLNYSMVAVAPLPPCLVELKPAWFPYGRKDWNQSKYNILELKMIYMWFSGQVVSALAFHLW
jgi:hypothetical protein